MLRRSPQWCERIRRRRRSGSVSVAPNENNVLSAIVSRDVANADSARVVYWTGSDAKQATPFVTDVSSGRTLVLGLRPSTEYSMYVEATGGGTTATSDTVTFTTGALPDFLSRLAFLERHASQWRLRDRRTPECGRRVSDHLRLDGPAWRGTAPFPARRWRKRNSRPMAISPRSSPRLTAAIP